MQHTDAKAILVSLIEGRNPQSGDPLPSDCFVHHSEVLRALLLGVSALESVDARAKRRAILPENVGQEWTNKEEEQLRLGFAAKEPLVVIATRHGRTVRAIEARLQRMGLITAQERTTRGGFAAQE